MTLAVLVDVPTARGGSSEQAVAAWIDGHVERALTVLTPDGGAWSRQVQHEWTDDGRTWVECHAVVVVDGARRLHVAHTFGGDPRGGGGILGMFRSEPRRSRSRARSPQWGATDRSKRP